MKLINFTIIKLTLFLILGVLFGNYIQVELHISFILTIAFLLILAIVYIISKRQVLTNFYFGVTALVTMFSIGLLTTNIHDQRHWENHYTQSNSFDLTKTKSLNLKVIEVLKPSLYQDKYFVEINTFNNYKVKGKLLLNIDKDSLIKPLQVDDLLFTTTTLTTITKPLNPYQFDYSEYLKRKNVYHQIHVTKGELKIKKPKSSSIFGMAAQIRETINFKLNEHHFNDDQLAIINAILLGQKRDLSKNMYQQYASAGVIHILAVSGLHVGILLMILQFLLKPIGRSRKGRLIKTFIIMSLLWFFAIIAGLSPSIVRAVTMFSIVAIGLNMKRPANIFNTLATSILILLLFKPTFLFDVGFQLSYIAVFAIVWIQPMLYKLWLPKLKVTNYFWKLFTVTIAAQIGVAPLSLFYFHQFPGLFFISNLVIIPVLGVILGLGVLVIILAIINALPEFIVQLFGGMISTLNNFVGWIAQQEAFLFKGISFGISAIIISYLLIVLGFRTLKEPKSKRLVPLLLAIVLAQTIFIYNKTETSGSFTVFHKNRHSIVAFQNSNNLKVYHNIDSISPNSEKVLNNYIIGEDIKNTDLDSLSSVYKVKDKILLVVDSLSTYKVSFKPDIVLLRDSPKVNLDRLIEQLKPKLIIADGSNYKSYVSRWEATCQHKKLPFHATAKKGALTIDYAK